MLTKTFGQLQRGDEFDAYIGLRRKRVRIVSQIVREGSKVAFTAHPCMCNKGKETIRLRFEASASVEVYPRLQEVR